MSEENFSIDDYFGLIDMICSYFLVNAFVPGRIEQWVLIWDFTGVALTEIPLTNLGRLTLYTVKHYKQRSGASIFLNFHWMLRVAVNLFSSFLDDFQKGVCFWTGSEYVAVLEEVIGLENV